MPAITIRAEHNEPHWFDGDASTDEGKERFLEWLRSQLYDRCVRDIHLDIKYSGRLRPESTNPLTTG